MDYVDNKENEFNIHDYLAECTRNHQYPSYKFSGRDDIVGKVIFPRRWYLERPRQSPGDYMYRDNSHPLMGAFEKCHNITDVDMSSANIFYIPPAMFSRCTSLKNVNIGGGYGGYEIDTSAFYGCEKLENINLQDCVEIGAYAFADCKKLKKVILGSIRTIRNDAFANSGLEELNLGMCQTIGEGAFKSCKDLRIINTDEYFRIQEIANNAFKGCNNIEFVNGVKVKGLSTNHITELLLDRDRLQQLLEVQQQIAVGLKRLEKEKRIIIKDEDLSVTIKTQKGLVNYLAKFSQVADLIDEQYSKLLNTENRESSRRKAFSNNTSEDHLPF